MDESRHTQIQSLENRNIILDVYSGHFVTPNSHISKFFDMTYLKTRSSDAKAVADALAMKYTLTTIVDTIICLDKTELIGAYLADNLLHAGVMSLNTHQAIYVLEPELTGSGQFIFRDNNRQQIEHKNCLILMASITSGETMTACAQAVNYYGGIVSGIGAIFSNIRKLSGCQIQTIFSERDVPGYMSYKPGHCELCTKGVKIDAIINGFGYSEL
jgi:orotate phosphoribosyltransferase